MHKQERQCERAKDKEFYFAIVLKESRKVIGEIDLELGGELGYELR